jgi:predicted house-cleaning noncanonical NTP pyrophosphatase (MazG superfamily)
MTIYNKLIRDKIPEIIKASGNECDIKILNNKEYITELNKKLQEELNEYYEDQSVDELADLVEVIYAILKHKEVPLHKFEEIREAKAKKRGAFDNKLFLKELIES